MVEPVPVSEESVERAPTVAMSAWVIRPVHIANLVALFAPGVGFVCGLYALRNDWRFPWIRALDPPAELVLIALAGLVATAAGVADWVFHRRGGRTVSARESRVELVALAGGGAPLFMLMAVATVSRARGAWLVPILVVALATAAAISYDELSFHGRAPRVEQLFHRALIGGMTLSWLSWMHFVFGRGAQ